MKIFNWVHRKFNHKDEFGIRDWKKEVVVDGSILSIGTFGFDHPYNYQQHNDQDHFPITTSYQKMSENIQEAVHHHHHHQVDDDIQEQEDDDESEAKPLMFTKFKEYDFDMTSPNNNNNNNTTSTTIMSVDGISLMPEITTSVDHDHKKKGEIRTTLADLFSADSHDAQVNNKADLNTKKRAPAHAKNNHVSFAKKLVPQVGDKSPLVNKLNQMMKRVMKRKIHPELHNVQATPPKNMDALEVQTSIDESANLLPIPGVIV